MPLLGIPNGFQKGCPKQFKLTAQDIIDALDNATTDELLQIEAILGIPPDLGPNIASLNEAVTTLEGNVINIDSQLAAMNTEIRTLDSDVNVLQGEVHDLETPGVIINENYIVEILGQIQPASWETIWQRILAIWRPQFQTRITFHCGTGTNNVNVTYTPPNQFVITADIYLGGGVCGAQSQMMTIYVPECAAGNQPDWLPIVVPSVVENGVDQTDLFQAIFDAIGNLYKCCPPCETLVWTTEYNADGNSQFTSLYPFEAVKLVVNDPGSKIDSTLGNPGAGVVQLGSDGTAVNDAQPWERLGQFKWIYSDGTFSEMLLWRFDGQRFVRPSPQVVGWEILPTPGVSYSCYMKKVPFIEPPVGGKQTW